VAKCSFEVFLRAQRRCHTCFLIFSRDVRRSDLGGLFAGCVHVGLLISLPSIQTVFGRRCLTDVVVAWVGFLFCVEVLCRCLVDSGGQPFVFPSVAPSLHFSFLCWLFPVVGFFKGLVVSFWSFGRLAPCFFIRTLQERFDKDFFLNGGPVAFWAAFKFPLRLIASFCPLVLGRGLLPVAD